MSRQIKGLIYFYSTDIRYSLMVFWTILLSIMTVSLAFSYFLLRFDDGFFAFGLAIPVYIYCSIIGFLTVKENIPFSLKLGVVRKNLFLGIGIFFLGLAFFKAVVVNTLHSIIMAFADVVGLHNFQFIQPAQLVVNNWWNRVIIDTIIIFFMLTLMYMIGLLFYKYGLLGGGVVLGIFAAVLLLGIAQGWVIDYFIDLYQTIEMTYFIQMFGVGVIIYIISYVFIRRITTIKVK
ncbi:hypothetical protein ACFOUV_18280 [Oceanobacillus longus]|uniref:ABC transporter permease n=1 Tax=Oceanobacillus longus TaxID=930120 RepID=A0ABV8H3D4_9BACI